MEMVKFFHMNGGAGGASYSNNSGLQKMGILKTKGMIEKAVTDLCYSNVNFPKTLTMADLGCSLGPNTLLVGSMLINAVAKASLKMGHKSPEIQINLNDLPTNDFNTIFSSLQEFQESSIIGDVHPLPSYYFTGVPGSFFERLFPRKTLHFIHSSYGLQWLSQAPRVGDINKGSIYLSSTTPESVTRMYYEQFQKDFLTFLRCRSEEMVVGGHMVLTLSGRKTDDPCDEESYYLWRPFSMALEDMVSEGLIDEAELDSFNLPQYTASLNEIKNLVEKEGSFIIDDMELFDVDWTAWEKTEYGNDAKRGVALAIRAAIEPLVSNHFGEAILDDVFMRYEKFLTNRLPCKEKEALVTISVSLIRKM
ncbi:salicylate carboxymethyltransferase-like [Cynara cardunculus var. scolymus]|uniref:salicylate carboxymethyltransferase-like n=1 Tax=Cynara cardunculus var. scolymus TaxID=59895 RepID=UPI000D6311BC|nr:salicylate carboxymethyltransferase-like [Cynara cardunculus var. scolymus]